MKGVGIVLILTGLVIFFFVVYNLVIDANRTLSPIPSNKGVRVIFISPTK